MPVDIDCPVRLHPIALRLLAVADTALRLAQDRQPAPATSSTDNSDLINPATNEHVWLQLCPSRR